jgi:hypothetical protein
VEVGWTALGMSLSSVIRQAAAGVVGSYFAPLPSPLRARPVRSLLLLFVAIIASPFAISLVLAFSAASVALSTMLRHTIDLVVRLWPPKALSGFLPLAPFLVALLVVLFIVWSARRTGYFFGLWREAEEMIAERLQLPRGRRYTARDRHQTLSRHMLESLRRSDFMFAVLVSGYTMRFRDEAFILEELEGHTSQRELRNKKFRFLFLNPDTQAWAERAEWLVRASIDRRLHDVDAYKDTALMITRQLEGLSSSVRVAYYDTAPTWRLYIFHDRVYVSRYSGPPASHWEEESDRATVIAYPRGDAMYDWLLREFRRLAPPQWQDELIP